MDQAVDVAEVKDLGFGASQMAAEKAGHASMQDTTQGAQAAEAGMPEKREFKQADVGKSDASKLVADKQDIDMLASKKARQADAGKLSDSVGPSSSTKEKKPAKKKKIVKGDNVNKLPDPVENENDPEHRQQISRFAAGSGQDLSPFPPAKAIDPESGMPYDDSVAIGANGEPMVDPFTGQVLRVDSTDAMNEQDLVDTILEANNHIPQNAIPTRNGVIDQTGQLVASSNNNNATNPMPGSKELPPGGPPPRPQPARPNPNNKPPAQQAKPSLPPGSDLGALGQIGVFQSAATPCVHQPTLFSMFYLCLFSILFIQYLKRS
ncbi:hypothetical protein DM01DRAFT_342419 [Hesseltinella vesiculosa]|uniref:Uncharacterized protein n=1 Tax=Hesseltinella vesiculosa TaxID=101127 RepID=A0A1X2G3S4_9FUNG|nr:hypothetical protein DM01DRAFT_342419 [Hesseltinella vesiculosa]